VVACPYRECMTERWEPRRFRWGTRQAVVLIVILVIVAVVAVVLVAAATFGALRNRAADERPEAEAAVTAYLQALSDDDVAGAYAQVCDRLRRTTTLEEFRRTRPTPESFAVTGYVFRTGTEGRTATVVADVWLAAGGRVDQRFQLIEEDGAWRVCG
jgi:hypothetical protein